jgi:Fe-S-cluster containining protein
MAHIQDEQTQAAIQDRFACVRCGFCCKGDGLVHCSKPEIERMARQLGFTHLQFVRRFAVRQGNEWILKDKLIFSDNPSAKPEKWCVFLDRDSDGLYGCVANDAKPDQCRTFPADWTNPDSMQTCPGLRRAATKTNRSSS